MAQDTTPAIEVYQGDGSNNTFSVHFDKGYYGEIKVAFVKRGLTDYEYDPDTYAVSGRLYAWAAGNTTYYTHTPNPAIGAPVYNEQDIDTGLTITEVSGITITVNNGEYTRAQQHDIYDNVILTWTGDTLNVGDYICIVRETERGQPYELPINQKQIEGALDNIERQVQELKAKTDNALLVDPTRIADVSLMGPVQWMETILRSIDLSVRELRYYDGWLQYSLDDPKSASEDKTWHSLLNTTNIKSIYYKYTEDEQGRPLYNVYYVDNTDTERLLTYDAQAQQDDINKLKEDVEINAQNIESEKQVRREADEALRQYIDQKTFDVTQFDSRITQNTNDISALDNRLHETVTALDPAMPKSYIDDRVAGMYHIKGAVDTVDDLPATGNEVGDCWNVIATAKTYLWTEDEEWVLMGDVVDLSPYRTAADQDVIDATKQDILTGSEYIDITNDVVTMTGKFGTSFTTSGTNLILKDQDNNTLSETMLSVGVDAEYTAVDEDIEFETGATSDYSFITERLHSIEVKIPDNASSTNKFATHDDIGRATLTIQKNGNTVDTFNANANTDKTINIPVPVNAADVSALPDSTKYGASMVASINSSTYVMTFQLKDQDGGNLGSAQTIDLPLETVVVSGEYDSENKKIVLTLKDGSTIDIPVGDLIAGLQAEITDDNKLSADLVDDTTTTHKFVTTQDKTNWDNKVTKTTAVSKVYGTDNAGAQTTYDVNSFGAVDDVKVDNVSVVANKIANIDLTGKVDRVSTASKVYGTDDQGAQTTYDLDSFGQVDDVQVDGVSVVTNKIANVNLSGKQDVFQLAVLPEPTSADDGRIVQYVGETIRTKHEFVRGEQGERTGSLSGWVGDTSTLRTKLASIDSELGIECDRLKFVVVSRSSGYYYDVYACEGATETLYQQNTNDTSAYGIRIGIVGSSDIGTYIYFDMIYDDEYNYSGNFYKCFKKIVVGEKPSAMYVAITNLDLVNSKIAEANQTFGITTAKLKFVLTTTGNNQFTVYAVEEDDTEHLMQADININNLPSTFGVQIAQTGTWTVGMYTELEYQYYWNEVLELAHLSDVELKKLEDGQALIYNATSGKWVNGNSGVSATYNAQTKTITFA